VPKGAAPEHFDRDGKRETDAMTAAPGAGRRGDAVGEPAGAGTKNNERPAAPGR